MAVLLLLNGNTELVLQPSDFKYVVEKYIGYDAGRYFESLLTELQMRADQARLKIDTDLDSYEASLDSNLRCFNDLLDIGEEFRQLARANRIDRKKLLHLIDRMESTITNQI